MESLSEKRGALMLLHFAAQIMTLPAVVLLEYAILRRRQTPLQLAAVAVVCLGVGLATVADSQARPKWLTVTSRTPVYLVCLRGICNPWHANAWGMSASGTVEAGRLAVVRKKCVALR